MWYHCPFVKGLGTLSSSLNVAFCSISSIAQNPTCFSYTFINTGGPIWPKEPLWRWGMRTDKVLWAYLTKLLAELRWEPRTPECVTVFSLLIFLPDHHGRATAWRHVVWNEISQIYYGLPCVYDYLYMAIFVLIFSLDFIPTSPTVIFKVISNLGS